MSFPVKGLMNPHKYRTTPNKCSRCKKMLKNTKKYVIIGVANFKGGFWSLIKVCKNCKHENVHGE